MSAFSVLGPENRRSPVGQFIGNESVQSVHSGGKADMVGSHRRSLRP